MNKKHTNYPGPFTFSTPPTRGQNIAQLLLVVFLLSTATSRGALVPGHVEAWGGNFFGQTVPPPGLSGVVTVAAGNEFSLALRSDGTVVAWGNNSERQTSVPQGLSDVKAIAAAGHCVALRSNGMLVVWGSNSAEITNAPAGLNGVTAIAAGNISGNGYTLALRSNGTVVAWGLMSVTTNLPPGLNDVVGIAAGQSHALALKNDGTVVGWGENFGGAATPPPGLSGIVVVRAGQSSSLAVKSDGTVVTWGAFPNAPAGLNGVVDVQVGANHATALRSNGVVVAWGDDFFGQGSVPAGLNGVTAISAGGSHNLVVTARPLILSISPAVIASFGEPVMFSVNASGAPLNYQWRHNGVDILAGTNSSLMIASTQPSDTGVYTVLVSNPFGSTPSPPTSLSLPSPFITSQPQPITRHRGESASFLIAARGLAPLNYQWFKADVVLPGETNPTLTLTNVRSTNRGNYQAIAIDAAGSRATSTVATLTIIDPTQTNSVVLTPVMDTSIFSSAMNPQGVESILAGTRRNGINDRGLLKFDLGSIPTAAAIQSANLRLIVTKVPRSPASSNFSLHRVFKFWGSDATWADATTGVPWSAPGGLSGADYAASSSGTRFVADIGAYDFGPSSLMAADVQAWLSSPSTNHGWMLKTASEGSVASARHFGSSESAQPPQLELRYTTPAPAPNLTNLIVQSRILMFRFDGVTGWFYRVEFRDNLESGVWTTATNVPAGPAKVILISVPATASRGFYRVIAE